jgi:hypothetical protein
MHETALLNSRLQHTDYGNRTVESEDSASTIEKAAQELCAAFKEQSPW